MTPPATSPPDVQRERILATALALFADLGYDETTLQMVADGAGVPVGAITARFDGRRGLYLTVMDRVYQEEQAVLLEAMAGFTPDPDGVHAFIDAYIDFFVDHPRTAAMWMQRRLHDAADLVQIEALYSFPQVDQVREVAARAFQPGVDVQLTIWTVAWCVHNFVRGGVPGPDGLRLGPDDPATLGRFRAHVHRLVAGLLR